MAVSLDGVITFYSWHHAVGAERLLGRNGFAVELVPTPRDLSSNCGTALRFEYRRSQEALRLLATRKVRFEAVHRFVPELDLGAGRAGACAALWERARSWLSPVLRPRGWKEGNEAPRR